MVGKVVGASGVLGLATALIVATGVAGARPEAKRKPLRFPTSDLFIEINATDGDAGLQMNLGGNVWRRLIVRDPRGRALMDVRGVGRLRNYGLTDMGFESNEPPFTRVPLRRFKARFPEGRYTFSATTLNGRRLVGSDRLTHDIPARPAVLEPAEDAVVDSAAPLAVRWSQVTRPRGIAIVRYIVIVTEESSERVLSMDLGPGATSAAIPVGFLEPGADYAVEVLARERSGNQTITEVPFRTSR